MRLSIENANRVLIIKKLVDMLQDSGAAAQEQAAVVAKALAASEAQLAKEKSSAASARKGQAAARAHRVVLDDTLAVLALVIATHHAGRVRAAVPIHRCPGGGRAQHPSLAAVDEGKER